jgi:hypothetical protein
LTPMGRNSKGEVRVGREDTLSPKNERNDV